MTDATPGPEGPFTPTAAAPRLVELVPVASTNIQAIGYDAETRALLVQFSGGPLWTYADVPPEAWEAFRTAPSIGRHFAREIRPRFSGMRIMPPTEAPPAADEAANA